MNLALLVLLALMWGVVLLPSVVRNHRRSLHHSMGGFQRSMQVLSGGQAQPRDLRRVLVPGDAARIVAPPRGAELARERRARTLKRLLFAAAASTSVALLVGGSLAWGIALVLDAALVAFVAALRHLAVTARRRREVARIEDHRAARPAGGWEHRRAVGV